MKVTVIDYGLSNLLSVERALTHLGAQVEITGEADQIRQSEALVLPGVGAFRDGMAGLEKLGLIPVLRKKCAQGTPLLGICLGMQMLFEESEEFGLHQGLGLIPGRVVRIPDLDAEGNPQRVPHISWDPLLVPQEGALARPGQDFAGTVLGAIQPGQECYFVHGYEAKPAGPQYRLADTAYGGRRVCAAAQKDRVIGFQFHPEKSGPVGLALLKSFLELCEN